MLDLTTDYLGLALKNPLVVSASPLCEDIENLKRMEEAGASAVVLHSLFEEQITLESRLLDRSLSRGAESNAEALSYFPDMGHYNFGPEGYLDHIRNAKAAVTVPVIGSLNGVSAASAGNWTRYARKIEEAGADALELNIYYIPTDPEMPGARVEQMYCDLVREVKSGIGIPLAVKLGHAFSAFGNIAQRLEEAGADALVMFNRFYQPDFDLEELAVVPRLTLSSPYELLLRLHWVALLYPRLKLDLAVTGGVHSAEDVVKAMMAGARVAMMTSALFKRGIGHLKQVLADLETWMEAHEYESIRQMRGSMSQKAVPDPAVFERANYLRVLSSYALQNRDN
jgi:dihydroorotate dehydrogenase (fumarate)